MQDNVTRAKADWEFLRDTVTPPPFYHNEHAWSVMWSLIEKRLASTTAQTEAVQAAPTADLIACAMTLESYCLATIDRFGPDSPEGKDAQFRMSMAAKARADAVRKGQAVQKLVEALGFYADKDGDGYDAYPTNYGLSMDRGDIIKDGGELARQALAAHRESQP